MNNDEYQDLLDNIQDQLNDLVNALDVYDIDIVELENNIKKLWKYKGRNDKTIDKKDIDQILNDIVIIDSTAKDCGSIEDLRHADITDLGRNFDY